MDSRITEAIYIYNSKGLFINKIARRGKGPEEYIDIQDVDINKWSKEIAVLDGYGTKINYYNYDGKFIKSKSTSPLIIYSLASIDSLNYILDKGRYPENNREKQVENARLLSSNLQDINYSGINIEKGMGNFHRNTQQQFWKFEEGVFF